MSNPEQTSKENYFQITNLVELLEQQDAGMRNLFAKAINLYAAPGSGGQTDREKQEQLRLAVEQSLGGGRA